MISQEGSSDLGRVHHPESHIGAISDMLAGCSELETASFVFRRPGEREIHLGKGPISYLKAGCNLAQSELSPDGKFVISPFDNTSPLILVHPAISFSMPAIRYEHTLHATAFDPLESPADESYLSAVAEIIKRLRLRKNAKTVFSRAIRLQASVDAGELFMALCTRYPSFYTFCWRIGGGDIWIGSSPELLLSANSLQIQSMALAGTRRAGSDAPWDTKNIEEQRLVTCEIENIFRAEGLDYKEEGPYTQQAGPVEHLRTDIVALSANEDADLSGIVHASKALRLARRLSPTPALKGIPVKEAEEDLRRYEHYDREFYGGFSGLLTPSSADFYVTLRCLKMNPASGELTLYVGSGITSQSVPSDEWKETAYKSLSLLTILR